MPSRLSSRGTSPVKMKKNYREIWVEDRDYNNGRKILVRKITYILTGGQLVIEPGYVVMGLKK